MVGGFEVEVLVFFCGFGREAGRRKKRIVGGLNEEGGAIDPGEKRLAAGTGPVVTGVGESIEWGGEAVVEGGEGFNFFDASEVELTREGLVFLDDLVFEAIHES